MNHTNPNTTAHSSRRLLVVAAEEIRGDEVIDQIRERAGDGDGELRVIAPALTETTLENAMGDVDDAMAAARERLDRSREALGDAGLEASGEVGDSDLRLAIQDALQTFDADEIVIVAHRDGGPSMEKRGIAEAEHDFEQPLTELFVEREGAELAEVEELGEGQDRRDAGEREPESGNLPPFSSRDVLGIAVAIIGTIVLVILAASGADALNRNEEGTGGELGAGFTDQSARLLIAGALGLINLAHVVGLTLFQAGPYRGFWRRFFANTSLFGTPLAIVVSILLLI